MFRTVKINKVSFHTVMVCHHYFLLLATDVFSMILYQNRFFKFAGFPLNCLLFNFFFIHRIHPLWILTFEVTIMISILYHFVQTFGSID
jgi:hypothetical protein